MKTSHVIRYLLFSLLSLLPLTSCTPTPANPQATLAALQGGATLASTTVPLAETPSPALTSLPGRPDTSATKPLPSLEARTFTLAGQAGGAATAVALHGDIAYAGIGTRLVAIDLSDPAAPRFLGQGEGLPGLVEALAVQGSTAYVGAAGNLYLYDVSIPTSPSEAGALEGLADPEQAAETEVILAGDLVYMHYRLDQPGGTRLVGVDVSNPAQPVAVESLDLAQTAAVTASDAVLYIANEGKLQMVEAANPGNTLGEFELDFMLSDSYWRYSVAVAGGLAYVGVTQQPLQVWDVRSPAQPARIPASQVVLPPSEIDMEAAGEWLYLVDMSNPDCNFIVRAIDISDADTLRYQADSGQFNCISDIAAAGDILIASTEGGLQIFDHSDPAALSAIGSFVHPAGFDIVYNVALNQNLVYLILGHGQATRLAVLDRFQAVVPALISEQPSLPLPLMQGVGVERLFVRGERLYARPGFGTMLAVDISQPGNPRRIAYEEAMTIDWLFVPAQGGEILYARMGNDLAVIDFSDPASPTILGTVSTWPEGLCDLSGAGRYLVAASCAGAEKVLYDLSDPMRPAEAGRLALPDQFGPYAVDGNTFYYVSTDTPGLIVLDISDLANPREISRLPVPAHTQELLLADDKLYLFMAERFWAVNLTDPAQPYLEASLPLRVGDYDSDGDLLYVAAYDAGLVIVQAGK